MGLYARKRENEKEKRIFRSASSSSSSRERKEKGSAVGVQGTRHGDRGGLAIARARDPEVPHPLCHQRTRVLLVEKEKRKRAKRFSGLEARLGTPEALGKSGHPPVLLRAIFPSIALAVVRSVAVVVVVVVPRSRASSFFDALQSFALRVALLASPDGNHVETESRNRDLAWTKLLTHFEIGLSHFSCRCCQGDGSYKTGNLLAISNVLNFVVARGARKIAQR